MIKEFSATAALAMIAGFLLSPQLVKANVAAGVPVNASGNFPWLIAVAFFFLITAVAGIILVLRVNHLELINKKSLQDGLLETEAAQQKIQELTEYFVKWKRSLNDEKEASKVEMSQLTQRIEVVEHTFNSELRKFRVEWNNKSISIDTQNNHLFSEFNKLNEQTHYANDQFNLINIEIEKAKTAAQEAQKAARGFKEEGIELKKEAIAFKEETEIIRKENELLKNEMAILASSLKEEITSLAYKNISEYKIETPQEIETPIINNIKPETTEPESNADQDALDYKEKILLQTMIEEYNSALRYGMQNHFVSTYRGKFFSFSTKSQTEKNFVTEEIIWDTNISDFIALFIGDKSFGKCYIVPGFSIIKKSQAEKQSKGLYHLFNATSITRSLETPAVFYLDYNNNQIDTSRSVIKGKLI